MRIEARDHGGVIVVPLTGDIDATDANEIGRDLFAAVPDHAMGLVLDITDVRYIDSGGVLMLFELAARLDIARRKLALSVPEQSPLRRLIKITRLEEVALLCASADECAEMLRT